MAPNTYVIPIIGPLEPKKNKNSVSSVQTIPTVANIPTAKSKTIPIVENIPTEKTKSEKSKAETSSSSRGSGFSANSQTSSDSSRGGGFSNDPRGGGFSDEPETSPDTSREGGFSNDPRGGGFSCNSQTSPDTPRGIGFSNNPRGGGFSSPKWNAALGALQTSVANLTEVFRFLYEAGQPGRTARNEEQRQEVENNLDRAYRDLAQLQQDNAPQSDLNSQQNIIDHWQRQLHAYAETLDGQVQQKATQATNELSDQIYEQGQQRLEDAYQGLTPFEAGFLDEEEAAIRHGESRLADAVLPGSGRVLQYVQAFGQGIREERHNGGDLSDQFWGGVETAFPVVKKYQEALQSFWSQQEALPAPSSDVFLEKDPFLVGFEDDKLLSATDLQKFASGNHKPDVGIPFDPDAAKAELWTCIDKSNASEDNKSILRYYCQNTDFVLTPNMHGPVAYDPKDDIICYNPNYPLPEGVSLDGALAHELAHRADFLIYDVPNHPQWKTAIEQTKQALEPRISEIEQWFEPDGIYYDDPYMCSIMDLSW